MENVITAMSYNLRSSRQKDGADAWEHRRDRVADVLRAHQPHLIGFQEAQKEQLDDLRARLSAYTFIGSGRLDGETEGEYCAIGFQNDRFDALDCATSWLSETPHEPGSIGWDASHARIVTHAQFRDHVTDTELHALNTHFDHQSPPEKPGETARIESARFLRSRVDEIDSDIPVLVTGDFNCREDEEPYRIMTADEEGERSLSDAQYASRLGHHGPTTTFNDFDEPQPGLKIDYVFVTADCDVVSHGAYEHTYDDGRYPSDHFPIEATILLPS